MLAVDGVTRDCEDGKRASRDLAGFVHAFRHYPRPSPAAEVAQLFAEQYPAVAALPLKDSFAALNHFIFQYNLSHFPDPDGLTEDLAGCVASAAVVDCKKNNAGHKENRVNYGFISDCGVAVVGPDGELKMSTPDNGPNSPAKEKLFRPIIESFGGWSNPTARQYLRTQVRNAPSGEGYGVFTGEQAAMSYVRTGSFPISSGDSILVYTDGSAPILYENPDSLPGGRVLDRTVASLIADREYDRLERLFRKKVRTEATLVVAHCDYLD